MSHSPSRTPSAGNSSQAGSYGNPGSKSPPPGHLALEYTPPPASTNSLSGQAPGMVNPDSMFPEISEPGYQNPPSLQSHSDPAQPPQIHQSPPAVTTQQYELP